MKKRNFCENLAALLALMAVVYALNAGCAANSAPLPGDAAWQKMMEDPRMAPGEDREP